MKRRTFIKGAIAAAVAAALPATGGAAVEYTHKTYAIATEGMDGYRMAKALAHSMMQTKEIIGANVLTRAFEGYDSGEGARRSVGVEGSPDRILETSILAQT